ncbi:Type II secretory pathway, pullulanase PulA [Thioclava sp. SK-1]|uniref:sulfotransferase family 2 domain-containing protein n=1 Tax=Thioclava sp. SK-1 TaxID=1889770 RepID=UPI000825C20C|nr:sulfotransferase family 2 domain-containing protein [Thioclava sp. SK-1]OCX66744.1 Type II secretory pathway, pullulanase PulA [Thioclava sp. SK-1]
MIVSHGRKFIFVHIPKTGGTALALALESRAMADDLMVGDTPKAQRRKRRLSDVTTQGRLWKHSTLADGIGLYSLDQAQRYFTFTLVRNPWDRIVSYYHWLRHQRFAHPAVALAQKVDFTAFLADPKIQHSLRAAPYSTYMTLPNGAEHCNAYLRLEHLDEDAAPLEAHLGFNITPLARANTSDRGRDWRAYYDPRQRDLVADLCRADITRFHYSY